MSSDRKQGRKDFLGRPFLVEGVVKTVGWDLVLDVLVSDLENSLDYSNSSNTLKITDGDFALKGIDGCEFTLDERVHPTSKEIGYQLTFEKETSLHTMCTKVTYTKEEKELKLRDREVISRLEVLESRSSPELVLRLGQAEQKIISLRTELDVAKAQLVSQLSEINTLKPKVQALSTTAASVYGMVNEDGTVSQGTGNFSVIRNTTGTYTIEFNEEFDAPPAVVAAEPYSTDRHAFFCCPTNITKKNFVMITGQLYMYGHCSRSLVNKDFVFIARGSRV